MTLSPELIAAIFAGLVALLGAVNTATAGRSRRQGNELREMQRENRELRAQQRLSDQWFGKVLRAADLQGWALPEPPEGLFDDIPTALRSTTELDPPSEGHRTGRRHRAAP